MMKTLIVAKSEFLTAVRSKGFIIGVLMMPVLMTVSTVVQRMAEKHVDVTDRSFAVVDAGGRLSEVLAKAAEARNKSIETPNPDAPPQARFFPTRFERGSKSPDQVRLELSDRVRNGDLAAFVEIPDVLLDGRPDAKTETPPGPGIVYYSDKPTYDDLPNWIDKVVNEAVQNQRLAAAGLTDSDLKRITAKIGSEHRGLATRTATGEIKAATPVDVFRTFVIPLILMFVLFFVVMSAVPQLLTTAVEEKMIRVSEVILGSVTPFELMMGKLVSSMCISSVLAVLYIGGGMVFAAQAGHADLIPWGLLPFFLLFMLLAVFFFGSVFIAIGSACSEIKDAQGLMTPAMIILILPILIWMPVLKQPNSSLAVAASLFPPATPMLMMLRLASQPEPPVWQVVLGIALTSASTLAVVWAAGRIFRIGILSQGKTPGFRQLLTWITKA